ncbi:hypothetical protein GCM10017044_05990 [Kordiimonas sediminis]|uniref:Uncharacterized protein n=1 Tax=Kordiimonas sediminis TaxID=1735581 RepID=A0A919ALN4_9PROT|nr:hypothetical protein [Kordiimonas sediminis]GHF14693.1 hypothetical protein GCM10017044_05990 [Kordiimonas sediminis]
MENTVIKLDEVEDVLSSLGLSIDDLHEVLKAGAAVFDDTPALSPPTTAGTNFYSAVVTELRQRCIPKGFSYSDHENFCTLVAPDGSYQIACCRGIGPVGTVLEDAIISTRSKRGPKTLSAIYKNQISGQELIPGLLPDGDNEVQAEIKTWFLLYDYDGEKINAELSLPGSFSDIKCKPDGWLVRIPLPSVSVALDNNFDEESPEPIDFSIKKRT